MEGITLKSTATGHIIICSICKIDDCVQMAGQYGHWINWCAKGHITIVDATHNVFGKKVYDFSTGE